MPSLLLKAVAKLSFEYQVDEVPPGSAAFARFTPRTQQQEEKLTTFGCLSFKDRQSRPNARYVRSEGSSGKLAL